jgi:hypothetical protein
MLGLGDFQAERGGRPPVAVFLRDPQALVQVQHLARRGGRLDPGWG